MHAPDPPQLAGPSRSAAHLAAMLVAALTAFLLSASAAASTDAKADSADPSKDGPRIGLKIGAQWSLLTQPRDPEGAPTLMHGTAFDGWGLTLGPSLQVDLWAGPTVGLWAEFDLLYSRHRAEGFDARIDTGARRTATLRADLLRIPALLNLEIRPLLGLDVGLGPELLVGLRSGATVALENTDQPPEALQTTPTTHVGLTGRIHRDISLSEHASIPVELRATWDPMVPAKTVERFRGFEDADNPGQYRVGFDWQVLIMTGFSWEL